MYSSLAVVLPSHAVVGTTESSLALVSLRPGFAGDGTGEKMRQSARESYTRNYNGCENEKTNLNYANQDYTNQDYTNQTTHQLLKTPETSAREGPGSAFSVVSLNPLLYFSKKCSASPCFDVAFHHALFAAAGSTVLVWDVARQTRTTVASVSASDSALACAWLLPHLAVSAGSGCGVSFWDARAGAKKVHFAKLASDNLYSLVGAENGVYAAGADGKVHFADLRKQNHEITDFGNLGAVVGMDVGTSLGVVFESGSVRVAAKNGEVDFCGSVPAAKTKVGCAWGSGLAVGGDGVRVFRDGVVEEVEVAETGQVVGLEAVEDGWVCCGTHIYRIIEQAK